MGQQRGVLLAGGGVDGVGDDLAVVIDAGGGLDLEAGPGRDEVVEVLQRAAAVDELPADVWAEARTLALTPAQVASPLARRPYDLRHAAVSRWLATGVPPPRVAERAGYSVEVLLRVYAKCLDDNEHTANARIDEALRMP